MVFCIGISHGTNLWTKGIFVQKGYVEYNPGIGSVFRAKSCMKILSECDSPGLCPECRHLCMDLNREDKRQKRRIGKTVDPSKVNLRFLENEDLAEALKEARQGNMKYRKKVAALQTMIDSLLAKEGTTISLEWSEDFANINKANFEKMSPLQKLFWDQQMKAASLKNKSSMRWHPMMIRLALNFQMTSSAAYENVRNAKFITLPSKRTLYDYTHVVASQEGVQEEILTDLKKQFDEKCKADHERYCCLMFDEMQIRSNLVFDKSSGEVVGYVKLNEVEMEFEKFESALIGDSEPKRTPARKILVYMIRNITCNDRERIIKGVVAVYSTSKLSAGGLFTRTWDVIYGLESFEIPVLALACDGASINRSFIKMNACLEKRDDVFETDNLAAPDERELFFVIDVPHILKCIRNSFANSYCHKKSRTLWNNGEDIPWQLIVKLYEDHKHEKFRKVLLKKDHIKLTSFSVMKVSLASAVMSSTVALAIEDDAKRALDQRRPYPAYIETVKFIRIVNNFFDCLNGHNVTSGNRYRNPNLAPYTDPEDPRFKYLQEDVLGFFDEWVENVNRRKGPWKASQRKKMLITRETYGALRISIPAVIRAIKFLLENGAKAVCARRFCQDPLEQKFSMIRSKGGSRDNPDLLQALHTRVGLHAVEQICQPNPRGNTQTEGKSQMIDDTPLPTRKKTRKMP